MIERPLHVAILDDDPPVRTALGRFLKAAGMTADAYDTSDKLFESVALKCPDCLLLDFRMPGMNGLDVLKHLGQRLIRIPTIIMTSYDEAGLRSACLNAGAIAYLNKPLDTEQLIQIINRISEASCSAMLPSSGSRGKLASNLPRFA